MCGIAGALTQRMTKNEWNASLHAMADTLVHRGPDDTGVWCDADLGIGLAHRRLSIVDLSAEGHQPMASHCERYVVAFNGEIYNHHALRSDLVARGHAFRGGSDTEVLLGAFSQWGVHEGIGRCLGMFAFGVWDRQKRVLTLGRDRIGEKPLYYGWQDDSFLFASELRALRVHPSFRGRVDRDALTLLLRHNYIPAPYSIYEGIRKVQPGTLVQLSFGGANPAGATETSVYWSLAETVERGIQSRFQGSDEEAVDSLESLLRQSIGDQMLADVPVGAFLSGGVDSSATVAIMQALSTRPVRTFTIGFEEDAFDESKHAEAVAAHLGTDHTCLRIGSQEALDVVPSLATIWDEPFADSSQIPTYLVSRLARESVTVSLSGDAGDELFGGYPRFQYSDRLWRGLSALPFVLRSATSRTIEAVPIGVWERILSAIGPLLPAGLRKRQLGDKVHSLAALLSQPSREALYRRVVSHWGDPSEVVLGSREPCTALTRHETWPAQDSFYERMMLLDMMSYLPDDILTKVDRAAMATSLETRVPLLDPRIVEFSWKLPLHLKVRGDSNKWILRQVLYRHVPRHLIERPKVGFGVPLADWLRGPLREWAEEQLSSARLTQEGFFNAATVREKWQAHLRGSGNWHAWLWNILMFQAWYERWHR